MVIFSRWLKISPIFCYFLSLGRRFETDLPMTVGWNILSKMNFIDGGHFVIGSQSQLLGQNAYT